MISHSSKWPVQQAYLLVLVQPFLRAISQICFKIASSTTIDLPLGIFVQPSIWIGILLQIISFPMLLQVHKTLPLSRVAPLVSVGLVWTTLLGLFFLFEPLDFYRITGIALIFLGAIIIGTDPSKDTPHLS